jgi:hypothetical protein
MKAAIIFVTVLVAGLQLVGLDLFAIAFHPLALSSPWFAVTLRRQQHNPYSIQRILLRILMVS